MATLCKYPFLLSLCFTFFMFSSASTQEADALLNFKAFIDDPNHSLSSWSNNSGVHHCNWTGITCIPTPSLYVSSIDLQSLNLSGEIPSSICELPYLSHLNLADNLFNQPIPLHLSECSSLETLNLSKNLIWGTIPDQISQFDALKVLDLSKNHIEGKIPESIGSLVHLQVLNLGSNLLSALQNLKLALFNVSFNQLSGRVPSSLISGLPASFLEGNSGLCGPGLPNPCSDEHPKHHSSGLTTLTCALISIAFAMAMVIVAAGVFVFHRFSKRKSQPGVWRSVFFYPLRLTEHDLVMGMDEKSALGNGGPFGRVYTISLPSGELVAIKKLVNFGTQPSKALKAQVKVLAKMRHKNIVKILGFCHSDESIFLIYEFLQKGSLGDLICRPDFELHWSARLRIATGVAQGLAYLHKGYVPHLLHRNLKSTNILLDADYEPKLTDFAIDRIVGEAPFQSTITSEFAHSCYNAPECRYSKKATEQMDVYSFGVVLLELITGRQAEDIESLDSLDIVKWVRRKVNITNGALQILDPKISSSSSQKEMLRALETALHCTAVMPEKRPSMIEVVKTLESLNSGSCVPSTLDSEEQMQSVGV
ncbi:hypothetical protein V6Z11_A09G148300 [Gossypium hirsutum]